MPKFIDDFLNRITMYRLVLYYLIGLILAGLVLCVFKVLPYNPADLFFSTSFIILGCLVANRLAAWAFNVPTNVESAYITALILALIISPVKSLDLHYLIFLAWACAIAMASKFILAIHRKHIFNPAALAVVITAFAINQAASWWVGTASMLPFVIIGGVLMCRKVRRSALVNSFLITAIAVSLIIALFTGASVLVYTKAILLNSALLFFGFVMLTEPLTTPPTKRLQIIYGTLVGFLFVPQIHLGSIYSTPELALVVGNVFSYIVSPKRKLLLSLKEKIQRVPSIYDFVFTPDAKLKFTPGQYLEWTLQHDKADNRGNRRYFTIASSPTEKEIIMGVKFYAKPSSFKKNLLALNPGDKLLAGQLAGDFTLPKDKREKLVLIAGGIGVTPFRSMIKYLLDTKQKRDVIIFYSNKSMDEIVYEDIFEAANRELGIKTFYTLTDATQVPKGWPGKIGHITAEEIVKEVPDYTSRKFYLSGPHSMVKGFEQTLSQMGVDKNNIKIDFFPGFA